MSAKDSQGLPETFRERARCADCGTPPVSKLAVFGREEGDPQCYCCLSGQTPEDYDPEPGKIETQATQLDLVDAMGGDDE